MARASGCGPTGDSVNERRKAAKRLQNRAHPSYRPLAEIAEDLVRGVLANHRDERTISLLAIAVSNLEAHAIVQLELPLGLADEGLRPGTRKGLARSRADRAVDAIRKRFRGNAVDYGSVSGVGRSVPDEFRRLVERDL